VSDTQARVAELLALYRRSHYAVALPDGAAAVMRIGEPAPSPITGWIGEAGFAVFLTACNPHSQPLAPEDNAMRMADLQRRLRATTARWLDGHGAIPGEAWREPGLLVAGIPLASIDALARTFGQNASVHVRARGPARLRLHRADWLLEAADIERDDG